MNTPQSKTVRQIQAELDEVKKQLELLLKKHSDELEAAKTKVAILSHLRVEAGVIEDVRKKLDKWFASRSSIESSILRLGKLDLQELTSPQNETNSSRAELLQYHVQCKPFIGSQHEDDCSIENFVHWIGESFCIHEHEMCNKLCGIDNHQVPHYLFDKAELGSCRLNPEWPGYNVFSGDTSRIQRVVTDNTFDIHFLNGKLRATVTVGYKLMP